MPTTLTNGIQLPDKGSVDWYSSMQSNYNLIDAHLGDTDTHVTAEDRANWNSKQGSLSQAQLDAIAQVATNTSDIATLQSGKANASHTHSSSDITDIGDYATKDYVDNSISGLVDNAPDALNTLNELSAALNDDSNFASTVTTALAAKADSSDLATVATSGSYTDLTDKPTINDSTITIQKNGSTVDTFTTNGSAKTIDIPVPTKTSDLTNDSNFVDTSNSAVASGITSAKVTDYDTHIADTDKHVTTTDKATWNTVTSKANDSDVVHNSGNETIGGVKTLSNGTLIVNNGTGSNVHGEIKLQGSRTGYIVADNSGDGVFDNANCGISILLQDAGKPLHIGGYKVDSNGRAFADNTNKTPVLSITSSLIKTTTLVPENDTSNIVFRILSELNYANGNPSKTLDVRFIQFDDANASSAIYSNDDGKTSLGVATRRWSKIYGTEYYYGSNNVEFSTKFVTTDTAQTISGNKSFSSDLYVANTDTTANTPNLILRNYKADRGTTDTAVQTVSFSDKNAKALTILESRRISNGNTITNILCYNTDNSNNTVSGGVAIIKSKTDTNFAPNADNAVTCGRALAKWSDVQTYQINGLTPSSLSLPDLSNGIDISGYLVNAGTTTPSEYTPSVNGWMCIGISADSPPALRVFTDSGFDAYSYTERSEIGGAGGSYTRYGSISVPVVGGITYKIIAMPSTMSIITAKFFPCLGNV